MISKIKPLYTKSIKLNFNTNILVYFYAIKRFKNIHVKYYDDKLCCFFNNADQLERAIDVVDENINSIQILYDRHQQKLKIDENIKWIVILNKKYQVVNQINPNLKGYGYRLEDDKLIIDSNQDISLYKEDVIQTIIQEIAKNVITSIVDEVNAKMQLSWQKIEFGFYKKYWGSYTPNKRLLKFSYNLIHYDYEVIHYVIVHELSHIVHQNHSFDFWKHVELYCPDYKKYRHILKVS